MGFSMNDARILIIISIAIAMQAMNRGRFG